MTVEDLTTNDKYEFVYKDWITANEEQDGWTELPVVVKEKQKQLPGEHLTSDCYLHVCCHCSLTIL